MYPARSFVPLFKASCCHPSKILTSTMADTKKDFLSSAYAREEQQGGFVARRQVSTFEGNPWWKFGGKDRIYIPTRKEISQTSLDDFANPDHHNTMDESVFNNADAYEIYKPIENYEGRHRFDPTATWSDDEEKRLVRKVSSVLDTFFGSLVLLY